MTVKKPAAKKVTPTEKRPRGHPSLYTAELHREICDRLAKGEPLAQICRDVGMPAVRTVSLWKENHPTFAADFVRARDEGYDEIASGCLEIADDARNDYMEKAGKDGDSVGAQLNSEHVQRSKLRIETRLRLLAKWDPRRYGDKLAIGGADDLPPIKTMSDDQLLARIAVLQGKVNAK